MILIESNLFQQVLTENDGKIPNFKNKGRTFNKVEASMQNIQKSLSISTLPQSSLHVGNEKAVKEREGEILREMKEAIKDEEIPILK